MPNHEHLVDRVRLDDTGYDVVCYQCGKRFEAKRSDAAFCSAKCRVRFSREPQKKANAIEDLRYAGIRAKEHAGKYKYDEAVFQAMLKLKKDIEIALGAFEKL